MDEKTKSEILLIIKNLKEEKIMYHEKYQKYYQKAKELAQEKQYYKNKINLLESEIKQLKYNKKQSEYDKSMINPSLKKNSTNNFDEDKFLNVDSQQSNNMFNSNTEQALKKIQQYNQKMGNNKNKSDERFLKSNINDENDISTRLQKINNKNKKEGKKKGKNLFKKNKKNNEEK